MVQARKKLVGKTLILGAFVASALCAVAAEARSGRVNAGQGPNGGSFARGGNISRTEAGGFNRTSGGIFRGANGAQGSRSGQTTINPDGSASHTSTATATGANGSTIRSTSDISRSADGTLSGGRTTTATNPTTGKTYNGSTQIDPETNRPVHTGSCTDASGATIPCR